MGGLGKALRWLVGTCLSLVLLYCGAGILAALLWNRNLPAFPVSWVEWLNRPAIPPLLDHVANFLLMSMLATLFRELGRQGRAGTRDQQI
jgi:hypothetical protein